jgi:beta-lactamase class A
LPVSVTDPQSAVEEILGGFAGEDAGRSVAVESLRGATVAASVRADVTRPGASLLKLPLVAAVYAAGRAGELDPSAPVRRSKLPPTRYASVLEAFTPSHEFSVSELCSLCLITSDNPIAEYLIGLVGPDAVNREARRLGCPSTRMAVGFSDGHRGEAGYANVTTARDAVALLGVLATGGEHPEVGRALENNLRNFRIPLRLVDEARVPHKTGTLPGVANDAGVIFGERTDLAVAFLCERQADTAATSLEIGDCAAMICRAVGEAEIASISRAAGRPPRTASSM